MPGRLKARHFPSLPHDLWLPACQGLGLTSSMNSQGWQAPPSKDGFFSPCSNRALRAGQSVPRTRSVTPSVTVSSPAMEYWLWRRGLRRAGSRLSLCVLKAQASGAEVAAPRTAPPGVPSHLFAPLIQDFHKLGWKPACERSRACEEQTTAEGIVPAHPLSETSPRRPLSSPTQQCSSF